MPVYLWFAVFGIRDARESSSCNGDVRVPDLNESAISSALSSSNEDDTSCTDAQLDDDVESENPSHLSTMTTTSHVDRVNPFYR